MTKLIDTIEGVLLLVLAAVYICTGIALAEGTVNAVTITVMVITMALGAALIMDMNRRGE